MHDRAYEININGSSGIINKVRDPTLLWKSPQLVSIWILCTVILRLTAWINMHLQRTVMKDHCVFIELFISTVKLFWHGRFSSNIGREVQYVIPMVKINSFVVYSSLIFEVKVWVIIGYEWFNQGFILEDKLQWWLNYCSP